MNELQTRIIEYLKTEAEASPRKISRALGEDRLKVRAALEALVAYATERSPIPIPIASTSPPDLEARPQQQQPKPKLGDYKRASRKAPTNSGARHRLTPLGGTKRREGGIGSCSPRADGERQDEILHGSPAHRFSILSLHLLAVCCSFE
jgi:hypothetical protein